MVIDEYGLGDERAYAIREVAELFGNSIIMLPERPGNRMGSSLETSKARALGWEPKRHLASYIESIKESGEVHIKKEARVLVFTTTFYPVEGPAEEALCALMKQLPDVQFDIVTTLYTKKAKDVECPAKNATLHRIGWGTPFDKLLLPFLGGSIARSLAREHEYLFSWSVMASYGTLAALSVRRDRKLPLLVTLADQSLAFHERLFLRLVMGDIDQVYASKPEQGQRLGSLVSRMRTRRTLGEGDAFANQIRFAYSQILNNRARKI